MRKSILLVFPFLPYPPRQNGVSIRYVPIIEHLSKDNDLHVVVITSEALADDDIDGLKRICATLQIHKRVKKSASILKKVLVRIRSVLPGGTPHSFYCYDEDLIKSFLEKKVASRSYDSIVWVSSWYIDIGVKVFEPKDIVLDAIDSPYLHHIRKSNRDLLHRLDEGRLLHWERMITGSVRITTYVSPIDAKNFRKVVSRKSRVEVVPNGVYLEDFNSTSTEIARSPVITLGFLGNMAYLPNIEAALRLARIFDALVERDANYRLMIIGRLPVEEIKALASDKIIVTGTVDNIWSYIDQVDYFVFPMLSGAGQQNKVLEAMYAKKVVVCNSIANGGIGGGDGVDLVLADEDAEFVAAIERLKENPERARDIAGRGHDFIVANFSWQSILPKAERLWFD